MQAMKLNFMSKDTAGCKVLIFINFAHQILCNSMTCDLSTQIYPIHAVNNAYFALAYKRARSSTDQIQFQISVQNKLK
jgi:hypothetical protein